MQPTSSSTSSSCAPLRPIPTPEDRWNALRHHLPDPALPAKVSLITHGLQNALGHAGALRTALPENWWERAYAHPRVHTDVHDPDYYRHFGLFDRLSFGDPEDPARLLQQIANDGHPAPLEAALAARDHGLQAALHTTEVDTTLVDQATDPRLALSYYTLTELAHGSRALDGVEDDTLRRLSAIALSTLLGGVERKIL